MKKSSRFAAFAAWATLGIWLVGSAALAFDAGDKVEIEYGGTWYAGQVKEVQDGRFFISYDGYDSSWDEWVESARLRVPEAAAGNDAVASEEAAVEPEAAPAAEEAAAAEPEDAAPAEAEPEGLPEITIRKSGSIWATVSPDGTIRVNGSISGEVEENGNVRVSGMNSGEIDSSGTIRKGGMIAGSIDSDGTLRANGSIVGSVDGDGTIRSNGSIWGEADQNCGGERNRNAVAAVLVFFAGSDFGF